MAASEIPQARFAAFVRQHTHDVRNALNSLELETAFLQEFIHDGEARESLDRVRRQVRALGGKMRSLSTLFQEPKPLAAPIAARDLFLIWQEQLSSLENPPEVQWTDQLDDEKVDVDPEMMTTVFRELLTNAAAFAQGGSAEAAARAEKSEVVFELREPKTGEVNTAGWGELLSTTRRGGYGLGLWSACRLLQANGARFTQQFASDERALVTRIFIPIAQ